MSKWIGSRRVVRVRLLPAPIVNDAIIVDEHQEDFSGGDRVTGTRVSFTLSPCHLVSRPSLRAGGGCVFRRRTAVPDLTANDAVKYDCFVRIVAKIHTFGVYESSCAPLDGMRGFFIDSDGLAGPY
jgi:hypothetical protein